MSDERKIKVSCGEVTLQLTLTSKLLAKPFEDAVLKPFLKAYSKRTGEAADVRRVARVEVDEEMLGDHGIAASVVLLARETVSAEIFLRPVEVEEAMRASELICDPFAAPPQDIMRGGASAGGRTVHAPAPRDISQDKVEFDEDNMTPVERLKKERREAREARERLEASAADNAVLHDVSDSALALGARVRVEGLTSAAGSGMNGKEGVLVEWKADKERWEVRLDGADGTVNVKAANLVVTAPAAPVAPPTVADADTAAASTAALAALAGVEREALALKVKISTLEPVVDSAISKAEDATMSGAKRQVTDVVASVGRLVAALDEIGLGDVTNDKVRADARGRRKQTSAILEGALLPAAHALQRKLHEAALPAAPPISTKPTAEIDSDED